MSNYLENKIEFVKGVGPKRAEILLQELGIATIGDMLEQFPFRYIDKTKIHSIRDIDQSMDYVQVKGTLTSKGLIGAKFKKRLVARIKDDTAAIELLWFKGAQWMADNLEIGKTYLVYGKLNHFKGKMSLPHPEIEPVLANPSPFASSLSPVYPSTEILNKRFLDSKARRKIIKGLLTFLKPHHFPENLPEDLVTKLRLTTRFRSIIDIHFPPNFDALKQAQNRLKFEELFFMQLKMLHSNLNKSEESSGHVFDSIGSSFNNFYTKNLPFELTGAQKRVLKEIRRDLGSGKQMNRLLQGDVGSGKTVVGLMAMLIAIDNGFQAALMAPTEILAQQHYNAIYNYVNGLGLNIAFLSGTVKGKKRKELIRLLEDGTLNILIGTHALIEDPVIFHNLGLAITDEQHRFGVAQRAKLWNKSKNHPPHILVMTATPIPRTLAMTLYGDLDISVIDELPPGRKPIQTLHYNESKRLRLFGFMKEEIEKGRQIYIVYPLIQESEKLDLLNLEQGYEYLLNEFPKPKYQISVVHGKMKAADKEREMQRFVRNETQIMVATTVIEVGVNIPNASVMIIENTERFGLSQLHQLRGRVGRGGDQSFCILMSSYKLSKDAKERIRIMCSTNDGFEIAEADLKLRGPGNIQGTQQSGVQNLKIADLVQDVRILHTAREIAKQILEEDPKLAMQKNSVLLRYLQQRGMLTKKWDKIS